MKRNLGPDPVSGGALEGVAEEIGEGRKKQNATVGSIRAISHRLIALETNAPDSACRDRSGPHHPLMTINEITERICAFRDARDWMQFHNPKEMTVALAAEAGELMQPFVWKSHEQSEEVAREKHDYLADEVADVAILLFEFAHNLGIPLEDAMLAKLARNEARYPVEKAHGTNAKYNEL